MKTKIVITLLTLVSILFISKTITAQVWKTSGNTLSGTLPSSPTEWIGSINAGDFVIMTDSVERARVTSTGNVGIGTSAPTNAKLEVVHAGGVHARFAYDSDRFIEIIGNGNIRLRSTDVQTNPLNIIKEGLGDMLFKTGLNGSTATRMVIMQGGNVGVGTTTPASKLDVEGGMSVGASYSGTTAAPTNGAIIEGDVGIGTNAPYLGKLHVNSTTNGVAIYANSSVSSNAYGGIFTASGSGTSNYGLALSTSGAATTNCNLLLNNLAAATNNYSLYSSAAAKSYFNGSVGIGTTTPAQKLDVAGTVQMTGFKLTTSPTSGYVLTSDASGVGTWQPATGGISGSCSSGTNYVPKMSSTTAITCSQIYDNGANIGIGTTSPLAKLDVRNNSGVSIWAINHGGSNATNIAGAFDVSSSISGSTNAAVWAQNSSTAGTTNYAGMFNCTGSSSAQNYGLSVYASGGTSNYGVFIGSPAAGTTNYALYSSATAKSYFNGVVGIGTTSPSYKLDVSGDIHNTGIMAVGMGQFSTYRLTINGSGYASSGTWDTSDQQFKTDIDSLQDALTIIKQLKPKTYYFDTANVYGLNLSEKKQYGFLAQEIEQVLPDVVKMGTKEADLDTLGNVVHPAITFKTMNYTELIAILTKGIQELQEKNDSLQTKVNNQDSINASQQNQINLFQNQLVTNNTTFQEQLDQLMATINNCCALSMQSSTNNSQQTKSMTIPEGETTQMDVELNNAQIIVLEQNSPNPFAERTSINYYLPDNTGKAQILFYNAQGKLIQSADIIQKGKGALNVFASDLSSGIYTYTLVVDGKIIETKKMIKQ